MASRFEVAWLKYPGFCSGTVTHLFLWSFQGVVVSKACQGLV